MSEETKNMIEPIPNWEYTYCYEGSRTCGKSYTQKLLDEKNKEIEELKAKLEMYENGVYFSSENDKLQQRIDKAIEYIDKNIIVKFNKLDYKTDTVAGIVVDDLLDILKGSDKE